MPTEENTAPVLTNLADSVTFAENTVNDVPQLLDMDVSFADAEDNFGGGTLTLSGLLAEDTVSVRNQGTAVGEIGFDGTTVTFGVSLGGSITFVATIGTLTGGTAGEDLTITFASTIGPFSDSVTSEAIDALIQNLTYANSSDTPTVTRDLVLNVTDAAGAELSSPISFAALAANPFAGIDVSDDSKPSFVDLDADGDLDLVVGAYNGTLLSYENDGAGGFTVLTGTANPFAGIDVGFDSAPSFVDLDADGDLDLVVGDLNGTLSRFANDGTGGFTTLGGANPFSGINVALDSVPSFVDLDADGDLDLVVGGFFGTLSSFANDGTGGFSELIGTANPFAGIDVGGLSTPSFVDLDADGDLDLVVGAENGTLLSYENDGAGGFTELAGAANPFAGIDVGFYSRPSFVDLDADGDLDLVVGEDDGTLVTYENTTPPLGIGTTVTVTPENDAPVISGDQAVAVLEGGSVVLTAADFAGTDVDDDGTTLIYTVNALVAGAVHVGGVSVATFTATQLAAGDVSFVHDGSETTAGSFDVSVADDDAASSEVITISATVTPVNDAPVLTGLDSVTFGENTVNDAPQLLDMDVSFADAEGNFDGGTLSLVGLLAEDTVSVRNQGTAAGEIGFDGTTVTLFGVVIGPNVTFGGVVIGTLAGGTAGGDLTVTFNGAATSEAIDALIQNLTYANSSDTPTVTRDLVLNVTDAAGADLSQPISFAALTGTANPFAGIDVDLRSAPSFVDLDADGDLDLVVGEFYGTLFSYENDGTGEFTALTGTANPFAGIDVGSLSAPSFVDLDADGDLDLVVGERFGTLLSYENDGMDGFSALTDTANPFAGINVIRTSAPSFVDLDADGDLDLVVGEFDGTLFSYENDGTGEFTALIDTANPFAGINVIRTSAPSFVDLDADGDLDLVVGAENGTLFSYENDGTGVFSALIDTANPFAGIDVGLFSSPSFVDLDADGDLDLVVGERGGTLLSYDNKTPRDIGITVTVTPENDAPAITGDEAIAVLEGGSVVLTATDFAGTDADDDDTTLIYTVNALVAGAVHVGGVSVATFTATQLAAGDVSFVHDGSETTAGSFDVSVADDDAASSEVITISAAVTPVNDAPVLTGLDSVTFGENTVNNAPQLLDMDVSFADAEDNLNGGTLSLVGLLAADTVSVRNQGTAAGEVGFDGTTVTFGGAAIGTLTGGTAGADLTVTFNGAATSEAIDALIQNLTYANSSDAPISSRDLVLNVTDAAGGDFGRAAVDSSFAALASNPLAGIDVGSNSTPSFVDLYADGDLDLVVGNSEGTLSSFANDGAGGFTALAVAANPFDGIDVDLDSTPSFVDLDADGDLDLVVGEFYGTLFSYENDGTGEFTALTDTANPFVGIDVGSFSAPSFVDLDADGDLDLVVGNSEGTLSSFANDGAGGFTALAGAANPFDGIDVDLDSASSFVDLDADGDLDLVVGNSSGLLSSFANDGAGGFSALTGAANPFDGIDLGSLSRPSFVDLDADGDLDLVVGAFDGTLVTYENTTPRGIAVTVTVTPENDAPTGNGVPDTVVGNEDDTFDVDLSAVQLNEPDGASEAFVLTIQGSEGRVDLAEFAGVTVIQSGGSTATVSGTAAALESYLQDAGAVRYTGAQNAFGDGVVTLTLFGDDGEAQTTFGTISINLNDVVDTQTGGVGNDRLFGDNGRDILIGNGGTDVLNGFAGNDLLDGGDDNDILRGSFGDDQIFGGDGDDIAFGGDDNDTIDGGAGADTLDGGNGNDTIDGGAGDDILRGGVGTDTINGGDDDDIVYGGDDNDIIMGDGGNDTLNGNNGDDTIEGGDGDDLLVGGLGNDTVFGNGGADTIRGEGGDDELHGGDGDDLIFGTSGFNDIFGDGGNDTLEGGAQGDTIDGGIGNDILRGNDGFDSLFGGDGDDVLAGGNGVDILEGGAGVDTLRGQAQADIFVFSDISHSTLAASDVVDGVDGIGTAGGDRFDFSAIDADTILAGDQSFTFLGVQTNAAGLAAGAGSMWVQDFGNQTRLFAITDNDASIDLAVKINDGVPVAAADYLALDFIL